MNKKGFSFKALIILLLVVFAVVPITILTAQINTMVKTDIGEQIWKEKQNISQMAAREIESYLENASTDLKAVAEQPVVGNFDDLKTQREFVNIFQQNYPDLLYVYVMDIEGNIVNVLPEKGWAYDYFGDKEWFSQVKETNSSYCSDSFISAATNEPMIFIVHPIKDEQGNFKGAIGANVDLKTACSRITTLKSGDTGIAFAIDKAGTIVAHPNNEYVLKQKVFKSELTSKVLAGQDGIGEYFDEDEQTEKITAYAPIKSMGWGVFFAQDKAEGMQLINNFKKKAILTIGICVVFALALGYFISKFLSETIQKLVKQMEEMANGDLRGEDITARWVQEFIIAVASFNNMKANLRNLIKKTETSSKNVKDSSDQLAEASNEVSTSVQELAQVTQSIAEGSSAQAEHSAKVLESLVEATAEIKEIDKDIVHINGETKVAYEKAVHGEKLAKKSSNQMNLINKKVEDSAVVLGSLETKSNKIGEILSLITDVADQTNLLSLNAAIEAARAGEHGKGFAVVAEEIRKLSEETNNSAKQISELISEIQGEIKKYIGVMDGTIGEVKDGVVIIDNAEKSFADIAKSVSALPKKIEEIAKHMNVTIGVIETGQEDMRQISEISQQLAAGAEEMAASTQEQSATVQQIASSIHILAKMAEELDKEVETFKL